MSDFITLRNISKRYGNITALDGVSFKIQEGEILAIVGHSGAGKTTLLRILALLEKSDEGEYLYNGELADDKHRKRITMVFQIPVVFNASVYSNIAYGLKIRGVSKTVRERKVREVLKLVNLEGYEKYNAKRLSGGEQQRVAIARAIAIEPELLLMDEPTANLDPANVATIEEVIKEISGGGTTVVLATHNLFQAKRLSDRTAHLFKGKLIEIAKTKEFFRDPKSEITRRFMSGELQC